MQEKLMKSVFEIPARPAVAVAGTSDTYAVRRIYCIGRNYAAHAAEMGLSPAREAPFYFTKFADDLVVGGGAVAYPSCTEDYQFEAELVIAIGTEGAKVTLESALDLVYGYAVGLDMTRRDLQLAARAKGLPWDCGKNFANSAPIAGIRPVAEGGHVDRGEISLTVNGQVKQKGDIQDLLWNCAEIIQFLSRYDRLLPGDLIYTGTPAGVAPVRPGDVLEARIAGLESLSISITEPEVEYR
jgi:fumarylpyruvate hydrolase